MLSSELLPCVSVGNSTCFKPGGRNRVCGRWQEIQVTSNKLTFYFISFSIIPEISCIFVVSKCKLSLFFRANKSLLAHAACESKKKQQVTQQKTELSMGGFCSSTVYHGCACARLAHVDLLIFI